MQFWIILLSLAIGLGVGLSGVLTEQLRRIEEPLIHVALLLLLVAMGIKIGSSDRIFTNLGSIGITALVISGASLAGSLVFVKSVSVRLRCIPRSQDPSEEMVKKEIPYRLTGLIVAAIVIGGIVGYFFVAEGLVSFFDLVVTLTLGLLLFAVGVSLGLNKKTFAQAFQMGWKVFLLPISVTFGSILGPVVVSFFLKVSPGEAAAVGAGFGWYSLSAILLTELHGPELGTVALISNTFRELITFVSLPFVVRYLGTAAGIASGGATTMDVTLPLIKEVSGGQAVLPAFLSGAILSGLVPILVPLLINL